MKKMIFVFLFLSFGVQAQKNITNASDATAPLHALKPDYPTPYGVPAVSDIQKNDRSSIRIFRKSNAF